MPTVPPSLETAWEQVVLFLTTYGLSAVGGIIILCLGWLMAGWAARAVDLTLGRVQTVDITLRRFLALRRRFPVLNLPVLARLLPIRPHPASAVPAFSG